jgi:hypothetical protein
MQNTRKSFHLFFSFTLPLPPQKKNRQGNTNGEAWQEAEWEKVLASFLMRDDEDAFPVDGR